MRDQKNKWIGVIIMVISAAAFFSLYVYFGFDGGKIDHKNWTSIIKLLFTVFLLPFGLYFGLLFYGGKKIALQLGGGLGLLLALSFILGFLLYH
jgi:hypothetical protein